MSSTEEGWLVDLYLFLEVQSANRSVIIGTPENNNFYYGLIADYHERTFCNIGATHNRIRCTIGRLIRQVQLAAAYR